MKRKLFLSMVAAGMLAAPMAFAQGAGPQDGKGGPPDQADRKGKMMQAIDTDGDGKISKAEFLAKHEERFNEMDANHDGYLSKDEMKAAWESRKDKFKEMREKRGDRKRMRDGTGPQHDDMSPMMDDGQ